MDLSINNVTFMGGRNAVEKKGKEGLERIIDMTIGEDKSQEVIKKIIDSDVDVKPAAKLPADVIRANLLDPAIIRRECTGVPIRITGNKNFDDSIREAIKDPKFVKSLEESLKGDELALERLDLLKKC